MEDEKIVSLYLERNENAIGESQAKYGKYCHTIAYNILHSHEDADECVSDTWHGAWNAIPPEKPNKLQSFFGRITRNIAIDRYRFERAQKRSAQLETIMDEYWECVPNGEASVEDEYALKQAINGFLQALDVRARVIFMRRYWYAMSVKDIADSMRLSESHVSVILHRTRSKFRDHLTREGIFL
ncbi:MAG: sigma-70 family RNA polymerase sigma factor [Clostridia bacterium]|nr:sigma-70 family RNA polymerase sigma factor [Clostridia bacterium]